MVRAMTNAHSEKWLTKRDVMDRLQIGSTTVDRYVDQGRLPKHKLGERRNAPVRFAVEDVEALLIPEPAEDHASPDDVPLPGMHDLERDA